MEIIPLYKPRFMTDAQLGELIELWHLSRTALAGTNPGRWDRLNWAAKEFHKKYPTISETAAYKDLDGATAR